MLFNQLPTELIKLIISYTLPDIKSVCSLYFSCESMYNMASSRLNPCEDFVPWRLDHGVDCYAKLLRRGINLCDKKDDKYELIRARAGVLNNFNDSSTNSDEVIIEIIKQGGNIDGCPLTREIIKYVISSDKPEIIYKFDEDYLLVYSHLINDYAYLYGKSDKIKLDTTDVYSDFDEDVSRLLRNFQLDKLNYLIEAKGIESIIGIIVETAYYDIGVFKWFVKNFNIDAEIINKYIDKCGVYDTLDLEIINETFHKMGVKLTSSMVEQIINWSHVDAFRLIDKLYGHEEVAKHVQIPTMISDSMYATMIEIKHVNPNPRIVNRMGKRILRQCKHILPVINDHQSLRRKKKY